MNCYKTMKFPSEMPKKMQELCKIIHECSKIHENPQEKAM